MNLPVAAVLRKNITGEVRTYTTDVPEEYADGQEFLWTEGNYACDCNRELFFERAGGNHDFDSESCGDERFELVSLTINGKQVIPEVESL